MSSPERAYLEVLQEVPETISFEHADQLLQGMTTLSPRVMEKLLRNCTHVKVRRLFYWMAERQSYSWLKKLPQPETLDELGLGCGNRMLVGRQTRQEIYDNRSGGYVDTASTYYGQVRLLTRIPPLVAQEPCFALKGGTAINLLSTAPLGRHRSRLLADGKDGS